MTLALSTTVIQNRLKALTDALDAGTGPGKLLIYDGTRPATGAAIATQNLLATVLFADPSAGSISGTTLTILMGNPVLASKTGIAAWGRMTDSAGTFVADVDVGAGTEVQLTSNGQPTTQLYEGGEVAVTVASLVEA